MSINVTSSEILTSSDRSGNSDGRNKLSSASHSTVSARPDPALRVPSSMGDVPLTESQAFVQGTQISSVRRTFCLFSTFDVILTFILWVIYTQLIGETGFHAFQEQVYKYTFKASLFDTVMLAMGRFVVLILFYALWKLRHWWPVAVTTFSSSAFLLTKVFLFDFGGTDSSRNPLSYCLLIVSFVLAWVETWFMDFKVLPWEKKELQKQQYRTTHNYGSIGDRRRLVPSDDVLSTATLDQYYSPVGTPEGSDVEEEMPSPLSRTQLKPNQLKEYKRLADKSWNMLWSYLHRPEADWKHESGRSEVDGLIHSMQTTDYGKVFRLQGYVEMSAKSLWEEMVHNINTAPSWNPTLEECHTVLTIDENTGISHMVAAGIGGLVSSRDFVSIRRWGQREGLYLSCGCSVDHPDWPETSKHVRGFNGPGGWVFKPVAEEPGKCIFIWFMNSDIKGWIPQRVMDQAMTSVLQDYLKYLRVHVATLRNSM